MTFHLRAVYLRDQAEEPIGLIVEETSDGPLRAVIWDRRRRKWTFSPDVAAPLLFDPSNQRRWKLISWQEAESIAQHLGTTLPSESELHKLCEAG